MALPILDGNQSATTLSTIIDGGAHIPAHTVVSLGSQAISDITSAVSGSVVSISNFPSTQTVAGTVTANVVAANEGEAVPDTAFWMAYKDVGNNLQGVGDSAPLPISGTVTANGRSDIYDGINDVYYNKSVIAWGNPFLGEPTLVEQTTPLPISGTVTLSEFVSVESSQERLIGTTGGNTLNAGVGISFNLGGASSIVGTSNPFPISGTVTVGASTIEAAEIIAEGFRNYGDVLISGTVTVGAMPNGSLTTRFGSVTTANTAQITSAVTNASRKYLLLQNIATSTVTIGIGFAPTTTQGIQLSAGGGLTFDAFCPTGAVYWLSSVTGSNWSILEG